jgi:hypothetical protein
MLEADIRGGAQLWDLHRQIQALGNKGLGREMSAGLRRSSRPIEKSIREEYAAGLPQRGGYAGLFSKSLRFRTGLRATARTALFRVTTFADGTHERRDIDKLERGELRHPVHGRSRVGRSGRRTPNPWAVTTVRGGFHRRGTDSAADAAEREMDKVLREFSARLIK